MQKAETILHPRHVAFEIEVCIKCISGNGVVLLLRCLHSYHYGDFSLTLKHEIVP